MTRANLNKRPGEVSAMFDRVADRYDLMNDVSRWARPVVAPHRGPGGRGPAGRARARSRRGPGTSSPDLRRGGARAWPVTSPWACSRSGRRRLRSAPEGRPAPGPDRRVRAGAFVPATPRPALPRPAFDAFDISFGLTQRGRPRRRAGRDAPGHPPGGRLLVWRIRPSCPGPGSTASTILPGHRAARGRAAALRASPEAYDYLAESIKDWPGQPTWRA